MGVILALLPPSLAWLLGVAMTPRWTAASPALTALSGAALGPAALRWLGRPVAEQAVAWGLGVIAWGGLTVGGDAAVLAVFSALSAAWCLALAARRIGESRGSAAATPPAGGVPGTRQAPSPPAADPGEELAFRVELRCPNCGGSVAVPVHHTMTRCEYCASQHMVVRPGEQVEAVVPDAVESESVLRRALGEHYGHLRYLELYDARVRPLVERRERAAGSEAAILADLALPRVIDAAEAGVKAEADRRSAEVAAALRITRWERFTSPYWHRLGTLYQTAFGRDRDGTKRMELAIVTLETSVPATGVQLPEMGKLSYLKALRPLQGAPEAALPSVPVDRPVAVLDERMRQLSDRKSELTLESIARRAVLVPEVTALIYRPWHLVEAEVDGVRAGFLVDGGAARVAAVPAPPAPATSVAEPAAARPITLISSACPTCGGALDLAPDAVAHLCRTCWRLVDLDGGALRPRSYRSERPSLATWSVPFWRFPLLLRTPDGTLVTDIAHLTDGVDGTLDQIGETPMQRQHLFVPAFRTRFGKTGVRLLRRMWPLLHGTAHDALEERFPLDAPPRHTVDVTLRSAEARVLASAYLALAFTARDLARAHIRSVRAGFLAASLEGDPEMVYLSLPSEFIAPYRRALGRPLPAAIAALAPAAAAGPWGSSRH